MLIQQVASKPNKPSLRFCLVSWLACTKFKLPFILTYFTSMNAGVKPELLTAHQESNQKKALQGENTKGRISYFDSLLSTAFTGLSFTESAG